ncbi:zinc ribbon domain-containing protein [uncultured Aquimarina sp.]|uniref:zinc ribbon domain-containing protein n=1 Tax=uncultured Aquimarina sp. TaxID=575652 RepID=UPI0026030DA6|nr:zinc ribbon domain-containing protein [uncultured Aquimarina sp.]
MEEITIQQPLCSQCNTEITLETKFCTNCGFPENGDEKEKAIYHAKKAMKKNQIKDNDKKINSARTTLYWMAGIFFVSGLFLFFILDDIGTLIAGVILAVIYLVLAYWSQKKPFAAILSGLLLYLMVIALNVIMEPTTLFKGIIMKIIILSFLIKGVYSASQNSKE